MKRLAILLVAPMAACATAGDRDAAPRVVPAPVIQTCPASLGAAPAYPDTEAALAAARDIFGGVQLLLAGRALRQARERELEAALAVCTGPPQPGG
jgi:hypothetical protein